MDNEKKVDALQALYSNILTEITFYQNQGDSTGVKDVVPIVIVPLLELLNISGFTISITCLLVPVIQCLSLQRGIQAHRFVAMLRGYAASIEEAINELLGGDFFLYNSVLVDAYIANDKVVKSKGVKNSWFVTALMHSAIWGICVAFFIHYNKGGEWWILALASAWFLLLLLYILLLCRNFSRKEKVRFDSKELANDLRKKQNSFTGETASAETSI